jgi:asparagine synthase (glutamine-hydrolysing)
MCGIAGLIGDIARRDIVARMLTDMQHRGPDAKNVWSDPNGQILFGHLRLSIIDLSTGDQPMTSPDQRYTIISNGEIYNYLELRPALEQRGWRFRTSSDTEVLLAGLALEGPQFLTKTNGMFAFALWDAHARKLLLARDRMGVKPLYYAEPRPGEFAFASDARALLELGSVRRDLDPAALNAYLALRYVPTPLTMFRHVKKFPAGHYAIYQDSRLSFVKYWEVIFESQSSQRWSQTSALDELEELLSDAVRIRLRSDVPYGAFLSGGLDSSVAVALMGRYAGEPIRTYSIGFSEEVDEREDALLIAQRLETRHHAIELKPNDFYQLSDVALAVDEPFPDPIVLAMVMLARHARKDVKVILTGEGADELFGGYVHHPHLLLLAHVAPLLPQFAWNVTAALAQHAPTGLLDKLFNYPQSGGPQLRQRLAGLLRSATLETERYLAYISLFTNTERQSLLAPAFQETSDESLELFVSKQLTQLPGNWMDRLWTFEHRYWLTDNILFKQDKTLMAESVEGREPFCDYRLVEFAARLPVAARISGNQNKVLLREAARRIIQHFPPPSRKKKAFVVPLRGKYGAVLSEMARDVLSTTHFRNLGIFNQTVVDALLAQFPNPSFLVGRQVMALMMFALWHERVAAPSRVTFS